jgi:hypothetical protein
LFQAFQEEDFLHFWCLTYIIGRRANNRGLKFAIYIVAIKNKFAGEIKKAKKPKFLNVIKINQDIKKI